MASIWAAQRRRRQVERDAPPIRSVERPGPHPLSPTQRRLWRLERSGVHGGLAYNVTMARLLHGPLDAVALREAANEVARRHEALRTVFSEDDGVPGQTVLTECPPEFTVINLRGIGPHDRQAAAQRMADTQATRPMDLTAGPPFRVQLLRLAEDEHVIVVCVHHIVADGWSLQVIVGEMAALYNARVAGEPPALPEPEFHLVDVVGWQQAWLRGPTLDRYLKFWRPRRVPVAAALPLAPNLSPPRSEPSAGHGNRIHFQIPGPTARVLRRLADEAGTTLFGVLLACYALLLYRHGAAHEIVIGSPAANRNRPELSRVVGYLAHIVPLTVGIDLRDDFRSLLTRVHDTATESFAHQALSVEQLVESTDPAADPVASYPITTLFALHSFHRGDIRLTRLRDEPYHIVTKDTEFPLSFSVFDTNNALTGYAGHHSGIYPPQQVARLVDDFLAILALVTEHPNLPVRAFAESAAATTSHDAHYH
ncbi:condensation domain-containing protein [Streptosporangium sp. NPDC006013]|uniref:condensation domain-containing protein n=1 Tax=Streptosporangium sp. NPDC006013 TaxID=3155596 RepID=UPI0033B9A94E